MKTILLITIFLIVAISTINAQKNVFPQEISYMPDEEEQGWNMISNSILASAASIVYYAHPIIYTDDSSVESINGNYDFELDSDGISPSVSIGGELSFLYIYTGNGNWEFSSLAPVRRGSAVSRVTDFPSAGQVFPTVQLLEANNYQGRSAIWNFENGTNAIVFNVDGVISVGNAMETCTSLTECNVQPLDGAQAVAQAWADKGYQIIYIATRPATMYSATLNFLINNNFPAGLVRLADDINQATYQAGKFQISFLQSILDANVVISRIYAGSFTEVDSALLAPISASSIYTVGYESGIEGSVTVGLDFTSHLADVDLADDATVPGINLSGTIDSFVYVSGAPTRSIMNKKK